MSTRLIAIGLACLIALVGSQRPTLADPAVTITLDADPSTPGVQAGRNVLGLSTFSVDVLIGSVSDLQAFNFELVYDETKISAPTITTGSDLDRNPDAEQTFLSSTGRTWACSPPAPSGDNDPSPTIGAAFLSCYSTGAPAGPSVGSTETLLARVQFNVVKAGGSSLTLRNVNTFRAGGIETGSCNPVVITPAVCTGASIALPVGGVAELPDVAQGGDSSVWNYAILAGLAAAGLAALSAGGWYARRRLVK